MSQPTLPTDLTREDVINQILASIASTGLGLSHVINTEGEKLQYVLGTIPGSPPLETPPTLDDLLAINKSIQGVLDSSMQNQMFMNAHLQRVLSSPTMVGPAGPEGPAGPKGPT